MRMWRNVVSQNSVFHEIYTDFANQLKRQFKPKQFIFGVTKDLNEWFSFMSMFIIKGTLLTSGFQAQTLTVI